MKIIALFSFLFFLNLTTAYAQSKYMDQLRTALSVTGGLGIAENSLSKLVGANLSVKGSIDFGLQIGSINIERFLLDDGLISGGTGIVVSGQSYVYFANQRRDDPVNFGVTFGGSSSSFKHFEVSNFGAGLFLSGNNMKPQKIRVTPSLEVIFFIINEITETESGRTYVAEPSISGSFSLGLSTRMSDSNIFAFEPGLIYNNSSNKIGFAATIGIIF